MDSYVIRIYRRDERNPGKVAGLVEFVERGRTKSFASADELMDILGLKEKGARGNRFKAVRETHKRERKKT